MLQCFCCWCRKEIDKLSDTTSLVYEEGIITMNEIVQCAPNSLKPKYHITEKMASNPHRGWLVFNAMFWPTLLFIIGFVGLFFTAIFLAKDEWRWFSADITQMALVIQHQWQSSIMQFKWAKVLYMLKIFARDEVRITRKNALFVTCTGLLKT